MPVITIRADKSEGEIKECVNTRGISIIRQQRLGKSTALAFFFECAHAGLACMRGDGQKGERKEKGCGRTGKGRSITGKVEENIAYRNAPRRRLDAHLQPADTVARAIDSSVPEHDRPIDRRGHQHVGRERAVRASVEHRRSARVARPCPRRRLRGHLSGGKLLLAGSLRGRSVRERFVCFRLVVEQRVKRSLGLGLVLVLVAVLRRRLSSAVGVRGRLRRRGQDGTKRADGNDRDLGAMRCELARLLAGIQIPLLFIRLISKRNGARCLAESADSRTHRRPTPR